MTNVEAILKHMADGFKEKIDAEFAITVQFDIAPQHESWHIAVEKGRQISIAQGTDATAQFYFRTNLKTLQNIADGKLNGLTAAAQASESDPAPLEIDTAKDLEFDPATRIRLISFIQQFFNTSKPEKIELAEKRSRLIHGGHAIPLYYYPGFRSAWYMLKKGERLNQEGDTNPFPQAFVFIEGQGFAKIGDSTVKVRIGESYLVPPYSDHVVWTESETPLVLIWFAWGDGA